MRTVAQLRVRFSRPLRGLRRAVGGTLIPVGAAEIANSPTAPSRVSLPPQESIDTRVGARLAEQLAQLAESLGELRDQQRQSLRELQELSIELAISIAEHLVHQHIAADQYPIEKLIGAAIAQLAPQPVTRIRLHPDDILMLRRNGDSPPAHWSESMELVPDAGLARGSCSAETDQFQIVSNLESQLSEIRQQLLASIDDAQTERRQTEADRPSLQRFPDRRQTA